MLKEMKTSKAAIEEVLRTNASTRNSDWILYCEVCRKMGVNVNAVSIEQLCYRHKELNIPHFETVRRMRQRFQAEGFYMPTEKVGNRRKEESIMIKDAVIRGL